MAAVAGRLLDAAHQAFPKEPRRAETRSEPASGKEGAASSDPPSPSRPIRQRPRCGDVVAGSVVDRDA